MVLACAVVEASAEVAKPVLEKVKAGFNIINQWLMMVNDGATTFINHH
jgi:hypothetical protein